MKWLLASFIIVGIAAFAYLVSVQMDVPEPIIVPIEQPPVEEPLPIDPGPQPIPPAEETPTPPAPPQPIPQPESYTVVPGDCLWNIAKRLYGSGIKYREIYVVNQEIVDPNLIFPGQKLFIPR